MFEIVFDGPTAKWNSNKITSFVCRWRIRFRQYESLSMLFTQNDQIMADPTPRQAMPRHDTPRHATPHHITPQFNVNTNWTSECDSLSALTKSRNSHLNKHVGRALGDDERSIEDQNDEKDHDQDFISQLTPPNPWPLFPQMVERVQLFESQLNCWHSIQQWPNNGPHCAVGTKPWHRHFS